MSDTENALSLARELRDEMEAALVNHRAGLAPAQEIEHLRTLNSRLMTLLNLTLWAFQEDSKEQETKLRDLEAKTEDLSRLPAELKKLCELFHAEPHGNA